MTPRWGPALCAALWEAFEPVGYHVDGVPALDLGTGCGVRTLHAAGQADELVVRHTYRDSGLAGDGMGAHLIGSLPGLLADGPG